jgi:hypothetical protein
MAEMSLEEMNAEVLECSRYGEEEDLRALLTAGADVNFADVGGATALHKAAANGHDACLKVLHEFGAHFTKNGQGNTPAHWAAQNGKSGALKYLVENFQVDVLAKNDLGRSILTEAFESKDTESISVCLSHDSASEERLINPDVKISVGKADPRPSEVDTTMQTDEGEHSHEDAPGGMDEANAVTHSMQFRPDVRIRVRELPITRADNPFGTETAPEDDTTGLLLLLTLICRCLGSLGVARWLADYRLQCITVCVAPLVGLSVWPASILLSQWVAKLARDNALPDMHDKMVLELGAGCGLPAIVAGEY